MQAQTRTIWLKVASDIVILFGLLTALAALSSAAAPTSFLADMIFWPIDGAQAIDMAVAHLLAAILGGIMAGWGVLLYLLTTHLYPRDPKLAKMLISASLATWFVVDSLGSFAAGAPLNVLFNLIFLALFFIPLWFPGSPSTIETGERQEA